MSATPREIAIDRVMDMWAQPVKAEHRPKHKAPFHIGTIQQVSAKIIDDFTSAEIETLKHDLSKSLADKAALLGALGMLLEAVNPSDRNAISMHEWNTRLKAASAVASEAITSAEAAS